MTASHGAGESLAGRRVAVFGGTGSLGRAVAERLTADGTTVTVLDARNPTDDARLQGVDYALVDALDEASLGDALGALSPLWGVVNVVGGYAPGRPLAQLDISTLRELFELNVVTAAAITKHAIPSIASAGRGGRIVHTSSRVAVQDGSNGFAYSLSKLGVLRLVEAAAAELKDESITVNCVMPSIIDTPPNRQAMPDADHERWPKPAEIAEVLAFLVSDASVLVSGAAIPVYGRA